MAQLAIKSHPTRGEEVVGILSMLGGIQCGYGSNCKGFYFIDDCKNIVAYDNTPEHRKNDFIIFTLEEFLKRYPYKVGDKIIYEDKVREVTKMVWEEHTNTVAYKLDDKLYCNVIKELQLCKEEELRIDFPEGYGYAGIENKQVIFTKIKPQCPKTYEECCEILELESKFTIDDLTVDEKDFLKSIIKLKDCRDAYWKIAGEWKYDVNKTEEYFYIVNKCGRIVKEHYMNFNHFLAFPTEEMRDAFYENFKDLIEQCKELL